MAACRKPVLGAGSLLLVAGCCLLLLLLAESRLSRSITAVSQSAAGCVRRHLLSSAECAAAAAAACCRFGPLASFNGRHVSSEEVAAAGALFGGLEATLDAALVRWRLRRGGGTLLGTRYYNCETSMLAVSCLIALVRRRLGALACLLAARCLNATVTAANTVRSLSTS